MENIVRTEVKNIIRDLKDKMVFISGPRQVGKTTLAKQVLARLSGLYLNWDNRADRKTITEGRWPVSRAVVVLDEIHKYRKWKNLVKGEYDQHKKSISFLVTGSARLDIYRRGGDSLQGRYHRYRLHPFTLGELQGRLPSLSPGQKIGLSEYKKGSREIKDLLTFGGFPEPFLKADQRFLRRWQKERLDRVMREDVRDLSNIQDLGSMELLADMLAERAGSMLSLNSLREDLEVSHRAVTHWMTILENLYYCYRLYPFQGKLANALKKESKLFLWDWSTISNEGAAFENLVAGHLLKFCHHLEDVEGYKTRLWYIRDKSKREVDFLVTVNRKPWFAVEAKLAESYDTNLSYFGPRLNIKQLFCVSLNNKRSFRKGNIIYTSPPTFFHTLGA